MRKYYKTFILFALFGAIVSCTPPMVYKSYWQKTPVVIDGQTNDWDVPLRFFDPKTKLNYSVSNDAENLYICIRATDDDNVSGITKRGLQIWIDTTGKKAHQVGIACPISKKEETSPDNNKETTQATESNPYGRNQLYDGMPDTARLNRMHKKFLERTQQMHVSGFRTIPDGIITVPNNYGINLGISWSNANVLVYEVAIPLKSFLKSPLSLSDSTRTLDISFNFSITLKRVNTGGGGMGRGMHGGGMGGGGMGGGMGGMGSGGGGGHSEISSNNEPETIWTAYHLTTKPQ